MSYKIYAEQNIQAIADAIREKNGSSNQYTTAEMAAAVRAIQSGIPIVSTNFADPDGIIINKYIHNSTGAETGYNGWSITSYIPIEQGKTYSVAPIGIIENLKYSAFYDENKQYLGAVKFSNFTTNKIILLLPPVNAKYVRFSTATADVQNCEVYEVGGV